MQRVQCVLGRAGSFIPKEGSPLVVQRMRLWIFFIGPNGGSGGLQINHPICLAVAVSQNERAGGVGVLVCLVVNVMLVT